MTRRFYANAAPQLTLAANISNSATSLTASGSFSGWPASFPYFAVLEYGLTNMEIVLVTNVTGSVATITRAQNGTSAVSHSAGATLDQAVVAQDLDEPNAHINASANVHGLAAGSSVVGTNDTQTLVNKTLTAPALTSPVTYNGDNLDTHIPPTGSIIMTALATAPSGWLLCDGSAVSRTTYPQLFTALAGIGYGAGDGTTTFNVPNLSGRFPTGPNVPLGHTLADSSDTNAHDHTLSAAGQALVAINGATHVVGTNQVSTSSWNDNTESAGTAASSGVAHSAAAALTGLTDATETFPPYLVVNFIIKT